MIAIMRAAIPATATATIAVVSTLGPFGSISGGPDGGMVGEFVGGTVGGGLCGGGVLVGVALR